MTIESCNNPVAVGRRAAVALVSIRDIKFFVHARWQHPRTVPRKSPFKTSLSPSFSRFLVLILG